MATLASGRFVECDRRRSSCLLQIQSFNHPTPALANATSRTFGAPPAFIPCTTARHNLATSFTRALSNPSLTTTRNSHSHHAPPNLRQNVLCTRSTMSNSQRTSEGSRLKHPFSILSISIVGRRWWAREDLNFRPHAYQARALTN